MTVNVDPFMKWGVKNSRADMCKNLDELCISINFGTRIGGVIRIFFGNSDISDLIFSDL